MIHVWWSKQHFQWTQLTAYFVNFWESLNPKAVKTIYLRCSKLSLLIEVLLSPCAGQSRLVSLIFHPSISVNKDRPPFHSPRLQAHPAFSWEYIEKRWVGPEDEAIYPSCFSHSQSKLHCQKCLNLHAMLFDYINFRIAGFGISAADDILNFGTAEALSNWKEQQ